MASTLFVALVVLFAGTSLAHQPHDEPALAAPAVVPGYDYGRRNHCGVHPSDSRYDETARGQIYFADCSGYDDVEIGVTPLVPAWPPQYIGVPAAECWEALHAAEAFGISSYLCPGDDPGGGPVPEPPVQVARLVTLLALVSFARRRRRL